MREDIYGGLKNAMERGATLDQAIASFINSGYAAEEVREAARALNAGAMYSTNPQSSAQKPTVPQQPTSFRPMPTRTQVQPLRVQPQPSQPTQSNSQSPQVRQAQPMSFQRPTDTTAFTDRLNQMRQNMQQSRPSPTIPQQNSSMPTTQSQLPAQGYSSQQTYSETPKRKVDVLLIILVIILLVSIGFFVASLLFKQQIADFLKSILA